MLALFTTLMVVAGLAMAGMAVHVARRRGNPMGWSLAAVLVSVAWWGLAYAMELMADDLALKGVWGDLKYVGVIGLAPAWLVFVLQYTGRERWVTRRLLGLLAVEPVLALTLLAVPATHDWVRYYPESAATEALPIVEVGPAFWVIFGYGNLLLLAATVLFVVSLMRLARTYRRTALTLLSAALLPWVVNLLHNLSVGPFVRIDLTPFAFTVGGGLLVWGLFHGHLIDLAPLARGAVLDSMADAVLVVDPFGRVVDVNPAAARLAGAERGSLLGRRLEEVLPGTEVASGAAGAVSELSIPDPENTENTANTEDASARRIFDVSHQALADGSGRPAGELVVLREVTERVRSKERLQRVLAEKSRVAAALQASMVPQRLPQVAGNEVASRYEPAGDGSEVGGDFLDVFGLDESTWGFVLGDVSGKGAEAAAVSAAARYTVRALAAAQEAPARTLREVNSRLLAHTELERHCTIVYGHLRPRVGGTSLTLSLAGHHPPLVLRANGAVEEVGQQGTALALFDDPELCDTTVELGPGDMLCVYTDGLVEARRGPDQFGTRRVADLLRRHAHLSADDLAGLLVEAVRGFHGERLADDLAMLLVRSDGRSVNGEPPRPAPSLRSERAAAAASTADGAPR